MLLSNLDLLATAPGGVARLRELILTLAVQGKLVPQDPADESASVLLQKIRAEKDRLIAEGKIKRDKPLAAITDEEKPFDLPDQWEWVRLGALLPYRIGKTPPSKDPRFWADEGQAWVSISDLTHFGEVFETSRKITEAGAEVFSYDPLPEGTLIMSFKLTIGKISILRVPAYHNEAIVSFTPLEGLETDFLKYMLPAVSKTGASKDALMGATLNTESLSNLIIAVPPRTEQSRIVTRVEELMRLCDALQAKDQLEAAQHAQLVSTLLGTLTASTTPEELAANWQRVAQHFDLLLDRPEAIDALEQTLLQLAVRGLLVPQDPQDEPASNLLARIRTEKDRLIAEGQIKRDKPLPPITDEEKPFGLPVGWEWTRFPDLCSIAGGATPSKANLNFWSGDIPWVSPKDMKVPQIRDAQDHISTIAIQGSLSLIPPGSLLMVVRGMILAHSFPVAETLVPVTINQDMKAATPHMADVLPFLLLLMAGMKSDILARVERSTHGTCKLESPKIFGMMFPFPPIAEQSRIVARVSALRRLCADLRQRLAAAQTTQSHLAQALVGSSNAL